MNKSKILLAKNYSQSEILELFHFMDWMLKLPEELANQFDDFIKQYEANKTMRYVTHIERKGIEKGFEKGRTEMLLCLLEEKFGALDSDIRDKICHLDENSSFEWLKKAITAPTLQKMIKKCIIEFRLSLT